MPINTPGCDLMPNRDERELGWMQSQKSEEHMNESVALGINGGLSQVRVTCSRF